MEQNLLTEYNLLVVIIGLQLLHIIIEMVNRDYITEIISQAVKLIIEKEASEDNSKSNP